MNLPIERELNSVNFVQSIQFGKPAPVCRLFLSAGMLWLGDSGSPSAWDIALWTTRLRYPPAGGSLQVLHRINTFPKGFKFCEKRPHPYLDYAIKLLDTKEITSTVRTPIAGQYLE